MLQYLLSLLNQRSLCSQLQLLILLHRLLELLLLLHNLSLWRL